jgi:hypothetical protein
MPFTENTMTPACVEAHQSPRRNTPYARVPALSGGRQGDFLQSTVTGAVCHRRGRGAAVI